MFLHSPSLAFRFFPIKTPDSSKIACYMHMWKAILSLILHNGTGTRVRAHDEARLEPAGFNA